MTKWFVRRAMGGASGGFTSGRKEIIELLRQRSRPYLFSNALPPVLTAASLKALDLVAQGESLRSTIREHTELFRTELQALAFHIVPGHHPIIPIMLGEAPLATRMADRLLDEGVYVVGFSYPVVPKGQARVRVQVSAAHTRQELDKALRAFAKVGRELGVIQ